MKLFRKWTAALLIIALSVSLAVPALADGSESRQHRISFGNNYVEFRDIDILPHGKENMLLFTLYVYNGNSSTLSFNDYFLKVRSKSGQAFTLKRLDTETNTIPARSGKEYRYYANTRSVSSISDLQFTLIRWDFSQPNYERTIGQIVIPQTSSLRSRPRKAVNSTSTTSAPRGKSIACGCARTTMKRRSPLI